MIKVDQQIVGWDIAKPESERTEVVLRLDPYERPTAVLDSKTYKIRPSTHDAALYITISDQVLEDGTRRPFEIFINTKDKQHDQWITAITRLVSAFFRQRLPFEFVVDELCQVVDPNGAYFLQKGDPAGRGKCPSIVAHIGKIIRAHCLASGAIKAPEVAPEQKAVLEEKRKQAEATGANMLECTKCLQRAVTVLEGCMTCTNCGDSKCG